MYRAFLHSVGGILVLLASQSAWAGIYSGPHDTAHALDPAIPSNSPSFVEWANAIDASRTHFAPRGSTTITNTGVNSLGDLSAAEIASNVSPGYLTVTFPSAVRNGPGRDFAVFENGFEFGSPNGLFAEFAYVEVSTNGSDFLRFDSIYTNTAPVTGSGAFAGFDVSNVYNLAGKHASGFGTPFDLAELASNSLVVGGQVDLQNIQYVRLVDIPGNGAFLDSQGHPILDNWLTTGTGGFDFRLPTGQGIGVMNAVPEPVSIVLLALGGLLMAGRRRSRRVLTSACSVIVLTTMLLSSSKTFAATFDDIQFWVGTGSNQAGFVIDWNDGKDPQSLMWGYRWDGTTTGIDMLEDIVAADPRLFAHVSSYGGSGVALYGLGCDLDNNGVFGVSPALSFDSGGLSVGDFDDTRVSTNANSHYKEGWLTAGYWSYYLKSSSASNWSFSGVGADDRILADGVWDGWSFAPNFSGSAPSEPIAAVPEPGTLAMLACAGLMGRFRSHCNLAT